MYFSKPLNYQNNQQDALYGLIYYSKSALQLSGDVFAHHQEHLTVFTVSGSVQPNCCWLVYRISFQIINLLFQVNSTCFGRCFRPSSGALHYLQYLVVFNQIAAGWYIE
jgi:hypothetical protein